MIIEPHGPEGPRIGIPLDGGEAAPVVIEDEPVVYQTPELLHGLGTLVQNALQFARATVEITVYWDKDRRAVIIEDDGPGFTATVLDRIGEPVV